MRRCGYVVTSLSGAVLLAVLTCLEQVTNDGRGITTRKLRTFPPFVPLFVSRLQHKCAGPRHSGLRLTVKACNYPLVTLSLQMSRCLTFSEYINQLINQVEINRLKDNYENGNRGRSDDKKYKKYMYK